MPRRELRTSPADRQIARSAPNVTASTKRRSQRPPNAVWSAGLSSATRPPAVAAFQAGAAKSHVCGRPIHVGGVYPGFPDADTFQLSDGTTPATADGDRVGYDGDQFASHPLLQATPGARATLKTNIQNGKPVLRFDGVDDYLAAGFTLTQPYNRFAVWQHRSAQNGQHYMMDGLNGDKAVFHFNVDGAKGNNNPLADIAVAAGRCSAPIVIAF